ncbi:MAG: segregation/condensation protein A [Clostridiales bacterium]|nr:segregation/condensation protein A [Clostridiales bacterium]
MAKFINSTTEDVKFHIKNQNFEGPIDLIVQMVKEAKIDIMDIFVSDITSQYLNYVSKMKELDYEYVSEYITMAATLIEIKASKLLPDYLEEEDIESELYLAEKQLISDIEKAMLLQMPDKLKPLEQLNLFYAPPLYEEDDYKLVIKDFELHKLIDAFKTVLERVEFSSHDDKPKIIVKESISVAEIVKNVASTIRTEQKVAFFDLFQDNYSKLEVINTFLAILELIKMQIANATQDELTKNIYLEHNPNDTYEDLELSKELLNEIEEYA